MSPTEENTEKKGKEENEPDSQSHREFPRLAWRCFFTLIERYILKGNRELMSLGIKSITRQKRHTYLTKVFKHLILLTTGKMLK